MSTYKYSKNWSAKIVCSFLEKYGRATEDVARAHNLSYVSFIQKLQHYARLPNQVHWERLKWYIKNVDRQYVNPYDRSQSTYIRYLRYLWDEVGFDNGFSPEKTEKALDLEFL